MPLYYRSLMTQIEYIVQSDCYSLSPVIPILMDPWGCQIISTSDASEFEDNFKPEKSDKLADSAEYLAILERKLQKLKTKNKVVDNLSAYRADCIDRLMREGCDLDPVLGDTESEKLIQE